MAMVVTTNVYPLTTPRTAELNARSVQALLARIAIFNGIDSSKTPDLEMANRMTDQMRGFSRTLPGDLVVQARLAHAETLQAVIRPPVARSRSVRQSGPFWPRLVSREPSISPSIS